MEESKNPFGEVVQSLQQSFTPQSKQAQFGLAEVLTPDPIRVRFAGMEFERKELLINYTLEPYTIGARGGGLTGYLFGATNICPEGCAHSEKRVASTDETESYIAGKLKVTDTDLHRGDLLFAYYSQNDQRLILLCKVV